MSNYKIRDDLYKKGFFVSLSGNFESTGFYPENINITTVDKKYLTIEDWRKIENAIISILQLTDIKTINERTPSKEQE